MRRAPATPPPSVSEGRVGRLRNAAAAFAGVAAVAGVIAPLSLVANGNDRSGPAPGPGIETPHLPDNVLPRPTSPNQIKVRAAEIHYRFPLAVGWPEDREASTEELGRDGPSRALDSLAFAACGTSFHEPTYRDRLRADWTDLEDVRHRQLTTYADAGRAAGAVDALEGFFRACPTEDFDDGYARVGQVVETDQGDQSWALVRQFERGGAPAAGLEVISVVRIGRAVFVDTTANETGAGPGSPGEVQDRLDAMASAAEQPVSTMCVYSEAGCPSGTPFSNRRRRP
jgi:hypothetical protein